MAAATGSAQQAVLERAFTSKNYQLGDAVLARAHQLAQQLHITPETFANHYDSYTLISDWSMEVTAQRLKVVADYLEGEQRKENSRPRAAAGSAGGSAIKTVPQAMRPTWEDLPDKLDYPTPSAKRQALDPAAVNPGTGSRAPGSAARGTGAAGTPQPSGQQQRPGGGPPGWAATPGAPSGAAGAAGTPSAPATAFAQRTNRGQVVAALNDHLPGPAACQQQQRGAAGVAVRPLGQPSLEASGHLFMMEVLDTKVHALDERIMDFADSLTAATRHTAAAATPATTAATAAAAGTPGPAPTSTPGAAPAGTPPPAAHAPIGGMSTPVLTPGATRTPARGDTAAAAADTAAACEAGLSDLLGVAQPLAHSVADVSQQPVWVAGRLLAEAEGAPLNAESLLLEGCRDASGGARVRLDVSCLPAFRLFPGQSVCAYGLNPTGSKFMAQKLVTHVPPPLAVGSSSQAFGSGPDAAAARAGGVSIVVAAGPYCLPDDLSYSPLEELLSYCDTHPPDVLLLLGPFVDCEHRSVTSGTADRTADAVLREEVTRRLAAWRSAHPAASVAVMPAVREVTALPVMPQPAMAAAVQAVGPADKAVALQNPSTVAVGPLVLAACSSDVLKALSAAEFSRVAPGAKVERLAALASHVLGQRSFYPLYPAPLGTCLDSSHYSQLQLPVAPDLLLMPSDLAPFAKVLPPATWLAGAPPGLEEAGPAGNRGGNAAASVAPVVVVNPGRLSRTAAGGTFAHVVVAPGAAPILERIRVEVKRV